MGFLTPEQQRKYDYRVRNERREDIQSHETNLAKIANEGKLGAQKIKTKGNIAVQGLSNIGAMNLSKFRQGQIGEREANKLAFEKSKFGTESDLKSRKLDIYGREQRSQDKYRKGLLENEQKSLAEKVREFDQSQFARFSEMSPENQNVYRRGSTDITRTRREYENAVSKLYDIKRKQGEPGTDLWEAGEETSKVFLESLDPEIRAMIQPNYLTSYEVE